MYRYASRRRPSFVYRTVSYCGPVVFWPEITQVPAAMASDAVKSTVLRKVVAIAIHRHNTVPPVDGPLGQELRECVVHRLVIPLK